LKARAIRNLPIRQPDHRGFSEGGRLILFLLGLALPFLLYVHFSSLKIKGEYKMSSLVYQRNRLRRKHEKLLLERESLLNPRKTLEVAAKKLNMVDEGPPLVMDEDPFSARDSAKGGDR